MRPTDNRHFIFADAGRSQKVAVIFRVKDESPLQMREKKQQRSDDDSLAAFHCAPCSIFITCEILSKQMFPPDASSIWDAFVPMFVVLYPLNGGDFDFLLKRFGFCYKFPKMNGMAALRIKQKKMLN